MNDTFVEESRARLMILESLVVMAVTTPYVEQAQRTPAFDAVNVMHSDAKRWFDKLADMPGYNPSILDAEASRMMGLLAQHVAIRLAR